MSDPVVVVLEPDDVVLVEDSLRDLKDLRAERPRAEAVLDSGRDLHFLSRPQDLLCAVDLYKRLARDADPPLAALRVVLQAQTLAGIDRYYLHRDAVAVDDVGKVINPLIVEGQVHGGVLQGISQALLEQVVYDENGQNLTSTLADYLIPSIESAPMVESFRTETPSPFNPLGVKGVGEAGTIAATPVIVNAVEDALSPLGVEITKMPLTPAYVHSLITGSNR